MRLVRLLCEWMFLRSWWGRSYALGPAWAVSKIFTVSGHIRGENCYSRKKYFMIIYQRIEARSLHDPLTKSSSTGSCLFNDLALPVY